MSVPEADGLAVAPGPPPRVELLGYPIDRVSMDEAVERCRSFLGGSRRPRLVITLNAAVLALAEKHQQLARVISGGDLILADGVSILWATRLLGGRLAHRVAGVDLMERLAATAHEDRLRVYFLGARPEVVRKVVERVESEQPGAVVAGSRDGYFPEADWARVVREIRESRADLLFVAMPTPFKEIWCSDHLEDLGVPVVLPVGGAFDVFAGFIPRAPRWMQDYCLEWFWRLLMEPRGKWRRYLTLNTSFVVLCWKEWRRIRRQGPRSPSETRDGVIL